MKTETRRGIFELGAKSYICQYIIENGLPLYKLVSATVFFDGSRSSMEMSGKENRQEIEDEINRRLWTGKRFKVYEC